MLYFSVGPKNRIWMNFAFSCGGGGSVKCQYQSKCVGVLFWHLKQGVRGWKPSPNIRGSVVLALNTPKLPCRCPKQGRKGGGVRGLIKNKSRTREVGRGSAKIKGTFKLIGSYHSEVKVVSHFPL